MNIRPISPSFKGLWQLKSKDFNYAGLGMVWDIDCEYHPFKDEKVIGKTKQIEAKKPESFIYTPSADQLRIYYCTHFSMGDKLDFTKSEFKSDKKSHLKSLDGIYGEKFDNKSIQKNFDFEKDTAEIMKELENITPEQKAEGRRLLDELMNEDDK